jgi:sugar O-acyltransferase (sialic acid O-acetyltransferase NeuD family)
MERLIIVGAGGSGRETLDIVEAINGPGRVFDFLGFVDDGDTVNLELLRRRGAALLGSVELLRDLDVAYAIAIGSGSARRALDAKLSGWGRAPVSLVHPAAGIASEVRLGPGAIIAAGARLTTNIRTGRHLHANLYATVSHDCELGDYVTLNPGVHLAGNVTLGDEVTCGIGAVIIQGRTVGARTTIGAGAVVIRDIGPGVTAVGVPATPLPDRMR